MAFISIKRFVSVLGVSALLVACGGGSDGGTGPASPAPTPPPPAPVPDETPASPLLTSNNLEIYGSADAVTGESVGFAVRSADGADIRRVEWSQLSGPATVPLLASHTQAIGFDVIDAGDYSFNVAVTTITGANRSAEINLTVSQDTAPEANIRLDHAATERGRVSLRVDGVGSKEINSIDWVQIAGPDAQNVTASDTDGPQYYIFFDAPAVTIDSPIVYEATINYSDQTSATDTAIVMVRNDNINDSAYFPNSDLIVTADMFAYRSDSPYADALESCIYNNQITQTCRFSELPLIGQQTETPTVDDIMDRTLVSHAWMGEQFENYLRTSAAGSDMVKLLRATTAIVISYDVRPSFYWTATGAIYLDGNNFWRTPQQRDTLNDRPDFRSDLGRDLTFEMPWRYVKDNAYYPQLSSIAYPVAERRSRSFEDLEASISWLMYHELGHANDFFPSSVWADLQSNDDPLSYFRENGTLSDTLPTSYPLLSAEMAALAQVRFAGETATATQRGYQGDDIEQFFTPDRSPSYYSYLNEREDFATLFERFMMIYRLEAGADVGIVEVVDNPELIITWGQRNRINEPALRDRLRFTVESILPELDFDAIQTTLPEPELLDSTKSWRDSVVIGQGVLNNSDARENIEDAAHLEPQFQLGPDKWLPLPDEN
ncbi:hypothetical protein QTP81_09200 [Alteromonas sp. ASW11-36]|uniref:Lipoprotein n=1 Tax=Alteromonas arenosi TaxID=3055817 RepID=A0ABT7SX54_9ALTE|nr:hypothetical protein [Alteromonas sp. ASW11-36]MDM7860773.1 hypothetical protein [Alteromonas sp. ASW11-36]